MKGRLLICVLLFSISSYAQSLTLKDLTKILASSLDQAQDFLLAKGYQYDKTEELKYQTVYRFSHNRSSTDTDLATRFLFFLSSKLGADNDIDYQTQDKKEFLNLKNALKINGYKVTSNYTDDDGKLCNRYENVKYVFILSTAIDSETKNSAYYVSLFYNTK